MATSLSETSPAIPDGAASALVVPESITHRGEGRSGTARAARLTLFAVAGVGIGWILERTVIRRLDQRQATGIWRAAPAVPGQETDDTVKVQVLDLRGGGARVLGVLRAVRDARLTSRLRTGLAKDTATADANDVTTTDDTAEKRAVRVVVVERLNSAGSALSGGLGATLRFAGALPGRASSLTESERVQAALRLRKQRRDRRRRRARRASRRG
ncbi:hypothetical protein JNJ66_04030 [Candidatus Saccharibacteria bacterium]|nr:hypothetical protein [Candidatus Saccharibacteria bacterium]